MLSLKIPPQLKCFGPPCILRIISRSQSVKTERLADPCISKARVWVRVKVWVMPWLHVKQNYLKNHFSLPGRPSEILLIQLVETYLKLLHNYFTSLLQLVNMFQRVQCG